MLVKVKVFPNSKKQLVEQKTEDSFKVYIKSKPEKGEANREVLDLLSGFFHIPKTDIKIIKGHKQPHKILEIKK